MPAAPGRAADRQIDCNRLNRASYLLLPVSVYVGGVLRACRRLLGVVIEDQPHVVVIENRGVQWDPRHGDPVCRGGPPGDPRGSLRRSAGRRPEPSSV
jgi:hypothetical protein